ncbi:hypothetical protein ACP70R_029657 [Stipagrostis hirtigluma subsp. patula]
MDAKLLLLLLLLASASCVNVAVTGAPAGAPWPVALAAYALWTVASTALVVFLTRRRHQ